MLPTRVLPLSDSKELLKVALPPKVRLLFPSSITELPTTLRRVPVAAAVPATASIEICALPPVVMLVSAVVEVGWLLVQLALSDHNAVPVGMKSVLAADAG